jgi:long-chain acyl-CoA synthetase
MMIAPRRAEAARLDIGRWNPKARAIWGAISPTKLSGPTSRDVMRRDADGFLTFIGRVDDMFNSGGENIYPAEVERVLEQHPDIEQAIVVPLADEIKYSVPVAFVMPRNGAVIREDAMKAWFIDRVAPYLHPRRVFAVGEIPLAQTNKVNRSLLEDMARELAAKPNGART